MAVNGYEFYASHVDRVAVVIFGIVDGINAVKLFSITTTLSSSHGSGDLDYKATGFPLPRE
jgi:hypothetical protein